ncbi:MAG: CAP domain-containing protein [Algoriphagus sp.]|uniref:CAP domain-containing protein n=1 Tax=Algoriphagus sp. TaxID=1872435 RepID=UPI00181C98C9|nr:CAP domain-containing protein [Algoriphagus sp.]NVJ85512.1 CAP domain-containing protein [Algoriphagus sp.]
MKKLFGLFAFLLISFPSFSQEGSPNNLYHYSKEEFFKLKSISKTLDLTDINYPLLHASIFFVTNRQRILHGLEPLEYSLKIEMLAAGHAYDMATYGFYSHQSKIRNKRKLRDRFQIVGLNPTLIAENISNTSGLDYEYGRMVNPPQQPGLFTYANTPRIEPVPLHTYLSYAEEIVKLWMESPGHRQNILNPAFKKMGCGSQVYGEKKFYNMPYFMNVQCFSD